MKTPADLLHAAADTFDERSRIYGDNYKRFGYVMAALFPKGMSCLTPADWNRMGILVQIVSKLTRYTVNFDHGGHADSAHDSSVYWAMLNELDANENAFAGRVVKTAIEP